MNTSAAHSLADHARRLLETVRGTYARDARRALFAGPMALLMWIRTRRMRKETEAAAKLFAEMMQQGTGTRR